jgi:hypothetical protein
MHDSRKDEDIFVAEVAKAVAGRMTLSGADTPWAQPLLESA